MNKPVKLFIVEGENRDYRFVNIITEIFFKKGKFEAKIINLPATQNIYMLYLLLKEDDFNTDIVEVLRDTVDTAKEALSGVSRQNIDEVYLFFDYDIHQNNLPQITEGMNPDFVMKIMLETFDNETENGKLYISYPMVEALYDYKDGMCETYSGCFYEVDKQDNYKEASGKNNPKASIHFSYSDWKSILNTFIIRLMCLFDINEITYDQYRNRISPIKIYEKECDLKNNKGVVFVLSGFPEFIFDYFKVDFWNANTKMKNKKYENCPRILYSEK